MELTKETILIVDDSRFHRTVIKELFSEHFHLLEAVSGLECMLSWFLISIISKQSTMCTDTRWEITLFSSQTELYCKIDELLSIIAVKENLSIPDNVTVSIGLAFSDPQDTHYDTLFAKADEALYESKHAGKGCCREYGISDTSQNEQERIVLVMTGSRNILSMLDFASDPSVKIRQVYCYDDLLDAFSGLISTLSGLYLDISEEADHGLELLEFVEKLPLGTTPVVAICREGCMEQIRFAASHAFISDLLFTPLEAPLLKYRIAAHEKTSTEVLSFCACLFVL